MLGGVTLNGAKLFEQANADIEKLEEQIQLAYELTRLYDGLIQCNKRIF